MVSSHRKCLLVRQYRRCRWRFTIRCVEGLQTEVHRRAASQIEGPLVLEETEACGRRSTGASLLDHLIRGVEIQYPTRLEIGLLVEPLYDETCRHHAPPFVRSLPEANWLPCAQTSTTSITRPVTVPVFPAWTGAAGLADLALLRALLR